MTDMPYYRARYYDPQIGRFISEDPIGFGGGMKFYSYVKNNPAKYVDPSGLANCVYSVTAHTMICQPNADPGQPALYGPNGAGSVQLGPVNVASGQGTCANNPSAACLQSVYRDGDQNSGGPIPPGEYAITYMYDNHWGDGHDRFDIAELPFDTYHRALRLLQGKRKAFEMHRGHISHGCINANQDDPNAMSQYDDLQQLLLQEQFNGGNTLHVVP